MEYIQIQNKEELDLLRDKRAKYSSLNFSYSEQLLQALKDLLKEKNAIQLFAKDAGDVFVGYIAAAEKEARPKLLWVVELFTDPKYQGQGIGLELQNLYKKVGFLKIDNPGWKEGITYLLKF